MKLQSLLLTFTNALTFISKFTPWAVLLTPAKPKDDLRNAL